MPRCANCRAVVAGTSRFCPRCGTPVGADASDTATQPQTLVAEPRPAPPTSPAPAFARRPGTSGLAVASFVLSLVWLAGLGSLLAVIFGARARGQIRRSGGTQGGSGLATAGLVIGIIGLLGAALFWLFVVALGSAVNQSATQVHNDVTPKTVTARVSQAIDIEQGGGIASVTVLAVEHPITPPNRFETAGVGKEFATVLVKVCAGAAGSQSGSPEFFFNLVFPDGTTVDPTVDIRQPSVSEYRALAPNQCGQGFVTFAIATGTSPTVVRYRPSPFRTYEWTVSS